MWVTPWEGEKSKSNASNMRVRPLDWRKIPSSIRTAGGFGIAGAYHRPPIWDKKDCGIVGTVGTIGTCPPGQAL